MTSPLLIPLLLVSFVSVVISEPSLSVDYYRKTCPNFEKIVLEIVTTKQLTTPTTAAAALRLFFHDCMVNGCDASVLVTSNAFQKAERDADLNTNLPGDGFDVVTRIKTALELLCPGVVSCSDVLAIAVRDLVTIVGGPFYEVRLGRRDGVVSDPVDVPKNLPVGNATMEEVINMFAEKGFNVGEMAALTGGGHTIGFSHCKEFADRIFNFTPTSHVDPTMNPQFAERMRALCKNYVADPTIAAFNDVMTPGKFDNMYFRNLEKGMGVLAMDSALFADERTRCFVQQYARNETSFFNDFSRAMEKLSLLGVKTGNEGEIRHRCDAFNNLNIN